MTNNDTFPICTTDSLAAYMIAETITYASTHRDDFRTSIHAFDDDAPCTDLAACISRFIDIDLDETTDNDTLLNFDDPDNIDLNAILNDDRLHAMLTTAYTLHYRMLFPND